MRLLKQRRYALVMERLPDGGGWRVGLPAMNLWVANPVKSIAKAQLKLKIARAVKLIERGKADLADSDAPDDNSWWEVRIVTRDPIQR